MPKLRFFLLLLLSLCLLGGCIRRGDGDASQVEVLRSGELSSAGGDEDIADVAYVNVRDKSNRVFGLHSLAETYLSSKGFTVTDNPSQAGYIIQITVLDGGPVDPDSLRRVVDAGYDAPSKLSGTGGHGIADRRFACAAACAQCPPPEQGQSEKHLQPQCRGQQPDAPGLAGTPRDYAQRRVARVFYGSSGPRVGRNAQNLG